MNTVLAVILGGSGTVSGPAIGAFLATFLPEFLRVDETTRFIAYGLILVVVTIYLPRGLVPAAASLFTSVARLNRKDQRSRRTLKASVDV